MFMETIKATSFGNSLQEKSPLYNVGKRKNVTSNNAEHESNRQLIGVDEACLILRKSKPTIYRMVKNGVIPCYKIGRDLYFYKDELFEFIYKCRMFRASNQFSN